ncbi:phosphotransferase family protein [Deinococcus arboris]|uniref:phosphotransferase family protein n=1 Tax=Deinococcus arboris TaxID=2682977 RepID=UPI0018DE8059
MLSLLRAWHPEVQVQRLQRLPGGVSATVTACEVVLGQGPARRVVVRQGPGTSAQQAALLRRLWAAGLPVPEPLYQAPGGMITAFVEGRSGTEAGADPVQLAAFLARLQALPPVDWPLAPLGEVPAAGPQLDDSLSEGRLRAALVTVPRPVGKTTLLHGDLWPGNTLWHAGQLSAVIDWEDAALGHPLADVGNTRLELLFFQGEEAMDAFTQTYTALSGQALTDLPYWDLRVALRPCGRLHTWGLPAALEQQLRERHRTFTEAALRSFAVSLPG